MRFVLKKHRVSKKEKTESASENRKRLLTQETPFAIKEAYVKMRTNMMFCMTADGTRPCRTFGITSARPSEGKSLTAANIAISCAMLGKRTLLIDADLRRPTQKHLWGAQIEHGLCDYLAQIGPLEMVKTEQLPLWVICTGMIPPNPSEMLSSDRMKWLLEEYSEMFDYVIIDTPPINTVADAQIISALADGMLVVAKSGVSTLDEIDEAVETVRSAGGNFCGVILNDMNLKSAKYSYRSKYGSQYGYKYGYKYSYKYGYGGEYGSKHQNT